MIIKATTESQKEQARVLINEVMPTGQYILRDDLDLIPIENREKELSSDRELLVLIDQGIVIGTIVLKLTKDEAYLLYLTRHQEKAPKGSGEELLKTAESQAKAYGKKEIRLSIACHPKCMQEKLENWYLNQGYQKFHVSKPSAEQKNAWKSEYQEETVFKYLKKSCQNIN